MDTLKPLIALLAIVNPIGVIPFFIHFTAGFSRAQRRRTVQVAAFSAFLVIAVSAVAGLRIIEFFGISLASFQVAAACCCFSRRCRCSTRSRPRAGARTSPKAATRSMPATRSPSCR